MSLTEEVLVAKKKVITDGYEMSIGELINLYKDQELVIDPAFQRLFRWDDERKTRFIESILLGIPIPSIFVHQLDNGVWELVDGLQRVSTILQFTGDLRDVKTRHLPALVLNGTKLLPSLDGKKWKASSAAARDGLDPSLQIELKRARIRVEILKSSSDKSAKFELFQRLNTGGVELTAQEVRNSIAISLNKEFHDWMEDCSKLPSFVRTTNITDRASNSQLRMELVLRFFSFTSRKYKSGLDVHEYLDESLFELATDKSFNKASSRDVFEKTFTFLDHSLGKDAFRKYGNGKFSGMFLMSAFEVIATGIAQNIAAFDALTEKKRADAILRVVRALWDDDHFKKNSGAGVRGTTRLANLLPVAKQLMKP
jgi:hypothetical protein